MAIPRAIRACLVGAVTVGVALLSVPAAVAAPVAPQSTSPVNYKHTASVSKSQMVGLRIAQKVSLKATKGKVLDYKKSRTYWGVHTTYRRQFAGAWIAAGGRLTNISQTERTKVNRYVLRAHRPSPPLSAAVIAAGTNCTGDTAYYRIGMVNYYFYDSCRTNDFKANLTYCMTGAGFAAAIFQHPGVAVVMAMLIAGCAASANWISTAQSNSSKNAILVVTQRGYDYVQNRYVAPVMVKPQ